MSQNYSDNLKPNPDSNWSQNPESDTAFELRTEVNVLKVQNQAWERELERMNFVYQKLKEKMVCKEEQYQNLEESLIKLQYQISLLKERNNELEEMVKNGGIKEKIINEQDGEISNLKYQIKEMEKETDCWRDEKIYRLQDLEATRTRLEESFEQIDGMKGKMEKYKIENRRLERENAELKDCISEMKRINKECGKPNLTKLQETMMKLEKEKNHLTNENSMLKKNLEEIQCTENRKCGIQKMKHNTQQCHRVQVRNKMRIRGSGTESTETTQDDGNIDRKQDTVKQEHMIVKHGNLDDDSSSMATSRLIICKRKRAIKPTTPVYKSTRCIPHNYGRLSERQTAVFRMSTPSSLFSSMMGLDCKKTSRAQKCIKKRSITHRIGMKKKKKNTIVSRHTRRCYNTRLRRSIKRCV